jgi:hypothetical protein
MNDNCRTYRARKKAERLDALWNIANDKVDDA